jgi:hypothetical protein
MFLEAAAAGHLDPAQDGGRNWQNTMIGTDRGVSSGLPASSLKANSSERRRSSTYLLLGLPAAIVAVACSVMAAPPGFATYIDPSRRFALDYPATMKVQVAGPNEVKFFHPQATFRIYVFIQKRPRKSTAAVEPLLKAFKKKLNEEMKDVSFQGEGKHAKLKGAQRYLICSFTNAKGIRLTQLVQYVVTEDRILQLIVSDRPKGFKNLEKVIRQIHASLRILSPSLK